MGSTQASAHKAPVQSGRIVKGLVLVAILGLVNVWQALQTEDGPDPAAEALHSPEAAVERCRTAIDSAFAGRDPSAVGTFEAGYLQGGEYEVFGTLDLMVGRIRTRRGVTCELQFRAESGWRVEHIALGIR